MQKKGQLELIGQGSRGHEEHNARETYKELWEAQQKSDVPNVPLHPNMFHTFALFLLRKSLQHSKAPVLLCP